jgi:hypothetical protein
MGREGANNNADALRSRRGFSACSFSSSPSSSLSLCPPLPPSASPSAPASSQAHPRCSLPNLPPSSLVHSIAGGGADAGCQYANCRFPGGTLTCQPGTVTTTAGSLCTGGSASYCAPDAASATTQAQWDSTEAGLVQASQLDAVGTALCTLLGGTKGPYWSDPTQVCPPLSKCDSSTCGKDVSPDTRPLCCSYIKDMLNSMCTGATKIDSIVTPAGDWSSTITHLFGVSACSDTNCYDPRTASAAGRASYSLSLLGLVAMVALLR